MILARDRNCRERGFACLVNLVSPKSGGGCFHCLAHGFLTTDVSQRAHRQGNMMESALMREKLHLFTWGPRHTFCTGGRPLWDPIHFPATNPRQFPYKIPIHLAQSGLVAFPATMGPTYVSPATMGFPIHFPIRLRPTPARRSYAHTYNLLAHLVGYGDFERTSR